MKRTIAILMAAMMLTGILTACSGTVGMEDGRAYGNVSTSPNGYVENDPYNGQYQNRDYSRNDMSGRTGFGTMGNANNYGTGMTGGR